MNFFNKLILLFEFICTIKIYGKVDENPLNSSCSLNSIQKKPVGEKRRGIGWIYKGIFMNFFNYIQTEKILSKKLCYLGLNHYFIAKEIFVFFCLKVWGRGGYRFVLLFLKNRENRNDQR